MSHLNAAIDLLMPNLGADRAQKIAFIDDETSITYAALDERSSQFAHFLGQLGIQREQRIALVMLDCIDWPVVFLGAIKAGVVPVCLNTLLTSKDYAYMFQDARVQAVFTSTALLSAVTPAVAEMAVATAATTGARTTAQTSTAVPVYTAGEHLGAQISPQEKSFTAVHTHAEEPCFWLYSSGSTGAPKGTVHRHHSLRDTARLYAQPILGIKENDVVFSAAKLFFAYGLGNGLSFPMSVGATGILMSARPTPEAVFAKLLKHQPHIFYGVPTLFAGMMASPMLATCWEQGGGKNLRV
ncbi:MAG: Benzoate-CoA ligase, partial [Pseudomonadota bacterium]